MIAYPKLSLRFPFEVTEVGGSCVALGVEEGADAYHGIIKLKNESAVFLFRKLQEGTCFPDLIADCMEEFHDPEEEVRPVVTDFLDLMNENGILLVDQSRIKVVNE